MSVFHGRKNKSLGLALLLLANCAAAGTIELSAAGGFDWYNRNDTNLVISASETDTDKVAQSSLGGSWRVGLGYSLFEDLFPYFNGLLFNLNVYQTATILSGAVWQYNQAQLNNYSFAAPVKSTRLMLDLKPKFTVWESIDAYAVIGAGVVWNSVSYLETANSGISSSSRLTLSVGGTPQFAYDVGAGCSMAFTKFVNLSLEYIYSVLGQGSPSNDSRSVSLLTPPAFSLQSHSILLGLSLRL